MTQASALFAQGQEYRNTGQYGKAHQCFVEAAKVLHDFNDHVEKILLINAIAESFNSFGHHENAIEYAIQALQHYQRHVDIMDKCHLAQALNIAAMAIGAMGYAKEAIGFSAQSLELYEAAYGEVHLDTALLLNNIGFAYADLKDADNALSYYNRSLTIRRQLDDAQGIAQCINNLGMVALMQGVYDESLQYLQDAYELRKSTFSTIHPDISISLNNLGILALKQKNYEQALQYFNEALEMRQQLYSTTVQPSVTRTQYYYAVCLCHLRRNVNEAIKLIQQVLAYRNKTYYPGHPEIKQILDGMKTLVQLELLKESDIGISHQKQNALPKLAELALIKQLQEAIDKAT